jgi:hypothetical protein
MMSLTSLSAYAVCKFAIGTSLWFCTLLSITDSRVSGSWDALPASTSSYWQTHKFTMTFRSSGFGEMVVTDTDKDRVETRPFRWSTSGDQIDIRYVGVRWFGPFQDMAHQWLEHVTGVPNCWATEKFDIIPDELLQLPRRPSPGTGKPYQWHKQPMPK